MSTADNFEQLATLLSRQENEMGKLLSKVRSQEKDMTTVKNENRMLVAALAIESAKAAASKNLEARIARLERSEQSLRTQLATVELSKAELHAELLHARSGAHSEKESSQTQASKQNRQLEELQHDIEKARKVSANDNLELKNRLAHLLQISRVAFDTGEPSSDDGDSIRSLIDNIAHTIQLAATSDSKLQHKNEFRLESYKEHINRLQIEIEDALAAGDQSHQLNMHLENTVQQLQVQLQEVLSRVLLSIIIQFFTGNYCNASGGAERS